MNTPASIAVDWGTTHVRAYLLDAQGAILARQAGDEGIMAVPAGGFPAVLARLTGGWLTDNPALPVVMAGMVGSRNGWQEAPYAECPASRQDLASALIAVTRADGGTAAIVPGVAGQFDGGADVMRGEETLIAGLDLEDGLACLPGTHSKWSLLRGSRIERFATFMTGEIYAALTAHTILGRLADAPDDQAGFALGLAAANDAAGLLHAAFAARANVLRGTLSGRAVRPYLSGLLVGTEIAGALALYGTREPVHLVAAEPLLSVYSAALRQAGATFRVIEPEHAFTRGIARISAKRSRS